MGEEMVSCGSLKELQEVNVKRDTVKAITARMVTALLKRGTNFIRYSKIRQPINTLRKSSHNVECRPAMDLYVMTVFDD